MDEQTQVRPMVEMEAPEFLSKKAKKEKKKKTKKSKKSKGGEE